MLLRTFGCSSKLADWIGKGKDLTFLREKISSAFFFIGANLGGEKKSKEEREICIRKERKSCCIRKRANMRDLRPKREKREKVVVLGKEICIRKERRHQNPGSGALLTSLLSCSQSAFIQPRVNKSLAGVKCHKFPHIRPEL